MPMSEARKRANKKHLESLDEIKVRVKKGEKEKLKAIAESYDMSLNTYMAYGKQVSYTPELIDNLQEVMLRCGKPANDLHTNRDNLDALRKALEPVMSERSKTLTYPMELFNPDGESPTIHVQLDPRAEKLIFDCIEMQNAIIEKISSLM